MAGGGSIYSRADGGTLEERWGRKACVSPYTLLRYKNVRVGGWAGRNLCIGSVIFISFRRFVNEAS